MFDSRSRKGAKNVSAKMRHSQELKEPFH